MARLSERLAPKLGQRRLVPATVWRPLCEQVFASADRTMPFGLRLLWRLHDRHLGITPALALALAQALDPRPGVVPAHPLWTQALQKLQAQQHSPHGPRPRFEVYPSFLIQRIAVPLITEASNRLGRTLLFCQEGPADEVTPGEYVRYARDLADRLAELVQGCPMFWQERAQTLAALSLHRFERATHSLPDVPIADFRMFWQLSPTAAEGDSRPRDPLPLPVEHQRSEKHVEGGVDGIKKTRNLTDLAQMLVVERLHPPVVVLDRLINSGFMALRRPPRREKRRDVLIVGLLPDVLANSPQLVLLKTCWCEALCRLGAQLVRRGASACEFRWVEGDGQGSWRWFSIFPEEASAPRRADKHRHDLVLLQGWLPSLLDRAAPFERLKQVPKAQLHPELDWFAAAWLAQRDHHRWALLEAEDGDDPDRGLADRFAHTHLLCFLPEPPALDEDLARRLFHALPHRFALGHQARAAFSIQFVPTAEPSPASWGTRTIDRWHDGLGSSPSPHELAGLLVQRWLQQWLGELHDL